MKEFFSLKVVDLSSEDTPFSSILACGNLPKAATEFFLWSLSEGTTLRIIESSLFVPDAKDKKKLL